MSKYSSDRHTTKKNSATKQLTRHSWQENDDEDNAFERTDELQSLVAKTLTDILDERLELTNEKTLHSQVNNTTKEEGVKLFSSSTCPLRHCAEPFTTPVRKKRTYSTSSNSSEDERLAESAVTHDFIFRNNKQTNLTNGLLKKSEKLNCSKTDVIANDRMKKKKKKSIKQVSADDT